jgi:hypothetical protein
MTAPDYQDADCRPPECAEIPCPAIACEEVRYAACENNQCVGKYECPDGLVFEGGHCVGRCESDDQCVIAVRHGSCCGGCPFSVNRTVLEQDDCVVLWESEAPEHCAPDPEECAFVGCPDVLCGDPGTPACLEGRCSGVFDL